MICFSDYKIDQWKIFTLKINVICMQYFLNKIFILKRQQDSSLAQLSPLSLDTMSPLTSTCGHHSSCDSYLLKLLLVMYWWSLAFPTGVISKLCCHAVAHWVVSTARRTLQYLVARMVRTKTVTQAWYVRWHTINKITPVAPSWVGF